MACNICELTLFKVTPQQTIVKTILIIVMFYSVLVPILKFLCSCPLKKKLTFMLKKQTLCKQERKITSSFPKSFLLSWWVNGIIACEQAFNTLALLTDSSLTTAPATTHESLFAGQRTTGWENRRELLTYVQAEHQVICKYSFTH